MIKKLRYLCMSSMLLGTAPSFAQSYQLELTDPVKSKVVSDEFIGTDSAGNIYVAGMYPRMKLYLPFLVFNHINVDVKKYIRKYDKNMQLISEKEILSNNPTINRSQINGRVTYTSYLYFGVMRERNVELPSLFLGGKYYMVTQDSKPPRNNYFLMEVDLETGEVNNAMHLLALSKNKNDDERKVKEFTIRLSPDSSHVMFLATYQRDKSSKTGVAYSAAVLTKDMKPVFTSNYTLPKVSKNYTIKDAQLTNDGKVLIVGRNYDKRQKDNPGYVSVFAIDKSTLRPKESRLKFGAHVVDDVVLSLNGSEHPLIVGFYKDKVRKRGFDGLMYAALNEQQEVTDINKTEFNAEFIASDRPGQFAKKLNRMEKKGKDLAESSDFAFTEFTRTSDGGYVAIAENYDVVRRTRTSTSGVGAAKTTTTTTEFHHYYDDLMVFRFDKNAKLLSRTKVAKRNVYIRNNDVKEFEQDYSSFEYDGDLYLVFNDDKGADENDMKKAKGGSSNATFIVCLKPDGTLKKDRLLERNQMKNFTFDPHKKLQRLSDNRLAFIATRGPLRQRKTIMGNFIIKKNS